MGATFGVSSSRLCLQDFTTGISSSATITSTLQYEAVDGVVVFVNGNQIARQNMPATGLNATSGPLSCISSTNRSQIYTSTVPSGVILTGNAANTVAAAVFVCNGTSTTGLLFDMSASYTIDPSTTPSPTPSDSPSGEYESDSVCKSL